MSKADAGPGAAVDQSNLVVDRFSIGPPEIIIDERITLAWESRQPTRDGWTATAIERHGRLTARLHVIETAGRGVHDPFGAARSHRLEWSLRWRADLPAAFELPITLLDATADDVQLFLPALHDDAEARGSGLYPQLDVRTGFAVRADRLPQVAALVSASLGSSLIATPDETPRPSLPGLVYSIVGSTEAGGRVRIAIRYPQAEWGHVPDPPDAAYLAKQTIGAGEDRRVRWRAGDRTVCRLHLMSMPPGLVGKRSAWARVLWQGTRHHWLGDETPFAAVQSRRAWVDSHLWSPKLGQYASPEGSDTAMAGFIEMSLTLAASAARLDLLEGEERPRSRALRAIDRWLADGLDGDGLMLPVRDAEGFRLGRRLYGAGALEITREPVVEPIRPIAEARALLALVRHAGVEDLGGERAARYRAAASAIGEWLLSRLSDAGLSTIVAVDGGAGSGDGGATASLVALLTDLCRDAADDGSDRRLRDAAEATYSRWLRAPFRAGRFGGVTLDASCPDREGIVAALDAALGMLDVTGETEYLDDARIAADALLAYVFAYRIRTFDRATDVAERRVSTLGASVVSPENQSLDPFPVGAALIRYGLIAGDEVAVRAGLANVAWCLDGRWAIRTPEGVKQTEQLNHTIWCYDPYFTRRGDWRRGMPHFRRVDSEHGWPQALPIAAWLDTGDVAVDWQSARVASLDHRSRVRARRISDWLSVRLADDDRGTSDRPLLVRILRPPPRTALVVRHANEERILPWPRSLVPLPVPRGMRFEVHALPT